MSVPTADLAIDSIRADIEAIRGALTRLGALPPLPERKPPRKGVVYVHIYTDVHDVVRAYTTQTATLPFELGNRIASVAVPWNEGDGLTDEEWP